MEWLERMNKAIEYIENHILAKIDYNQLAKITCCSTYHFQRMFSFITNVTLAEYVRRRRLTLAAFELQNKNIKVIDIALKFGYDSPEAFTRAFKKMHGVAPVIVRNKGVLLKAYPKMSFHISIKGDSEMNYKIVEKEKFEMFGISTKINSDGENPFIEIPKFWGKCLEDGMVDKIRNVAGLPENYPIHAVLYNQKENEFSYMIGYYVPRNNCTEEFERLLVPKLTYAIFSTGLYEDGEGDIQSLWKRIFQEWFPTCNYKQEYGPELEMTYDRGNNMYEMEIWMPVVEKR
jgi:AraC family transcriptional regulator